MSRRKILPAAGRVIALLALACGAALADEWMSPSTKQYHSPGKQYYFEVVPGKRNAAGSESHARGTLFKTGADGKGKRVWSARLVNEVAPVTAVVADRGDYVATFDNWYQKGYGQGVVAIYGPGGRLVKSFELGDLFSKKEIEAFPHSVSSIHWGGEHYIDEAGRALVLRVVADGKMHGEGASRYREVKIDLATGTRVGK